MNIFAKTYYYLIKIYLIFKDIRLKLGADESKDCSADESLKYKKVWCKMKNVNTRFKCDF